jgi:hypothetical protein
MTKIIITRSNDETKDELHRHRCEVRYVCSLGSRATDFLAAVELKRGKPAADDLRKVAREQYQLGNRGSKDDWRMM